MNYKIKINYCIAYYFFDSNGKNYYAWNLVTWNKDGKMYYDGYPITELHPVENVDGI